MHLMHHDCGNVQIYFTISNLRERIKLKMDQGMNDARSPRFFRWVVSLIFSIITLGSLVQVVSTNTVLRIYDVCSRLYPIAYIIVLYVTCYTSYSYICMSCKL